MNKFFSVFAMVIGIILFIVGLTIKIPSKELSTHSFMSNEYSVIEEYVGGDAYNYIIGASLVGGEIAGAKTQKAIFISMGSLVFVIGMLAYSFSKEKIKKSANINASSSIENSIIGENINNNTNTNEVTNIEV